MTTNRNAKAIQTKSRTHEVHPLSANAYEVTSGNSGKAYRVTLLPGGGAACTCDWAKYRPASNGGKCGCSHVLAVYQWQAQFDGKASVSAWASEEKAAKQHRPAITIGDGLVITLRSK